MEQCRGKIRYDTKLEAQQAMDRLVNETIKTPDDPLLENLNVYKHQGHWHYGHAHKTPLQSLLITIRRNQK